MTALPRPLSDQISEVLAGVQINGNEVTIRCAVASYARTEAEAREHLRLAVPEAQKLRDALDRLIAVATGTGSKT